MSKSADLDPKTNLTTGSEAMAVATVERLTVFGSPLLLGGEDEATFDDFLSRVYAAVKPVDIIDEMYINDVASIEWEILRWHRLKSSLMQIRGRKALEKFLRKHLDYLQYWKFFEKDLAELLQRDLICLAQDDPQILAHQCAINDDPNADEKVNQILTRMNLTMKHVQVCALARKADQLAREYLRRRPSAIKLVDGLLAKVGLSIDALMVEEIADELDNIERIDRLTTIAETRRNAALREVERRRAGFGEGLRRHFERELEVIANVPAEAKDAA